ncbi:probable G-protein coupled receptor Mth-like 3 isoform X1 [Chironomus tepperi]|uniref:probable G-protein coupled receptor Mth-like 3 isoform X1 n=1 Tax=Chironomus tepperi TaxID=113505 RepID=UPI00391F7533
MNKKCLVSIIVVLIYLVLFLMFTYYFEKSQECSYFSPCIRFCSADRVNNSDDFYVEEFKKSKTGKDMIILETNFKVFRGTPPCGDMTHSHFKNKGNFSKLPYRFDYSGSIVVNNEVYSPSRYCFEKSENDWKLMICHQDYYLQKVMHILTISLSILILGFTLFVYTYFNELKDFYGKCIASLVASQILSFGLIPIVRYVSNDSLSHMSHELFDVVLSLFAMSLMLALLWITAMIVHMFLKIRNSKYQTSELNDFPTYAIFVWTFAAFSAVVFYLDLQSIGFEFEYLITIYFIIAVLDIILLIITGIKIIKIIRNPGSSGKAEHDSDIKLYWIIIKLSFIMLISWPFEASLWREDFNIQTETIVDFVNLLTAATISIILLGRGKTKILLLRNYREIADEENDVDELNKNYRLMA